jgi:hypothetical protein
MTTTIYLAVVRLDHQTTEYYLADKVTVLLGGVFELQGAQRLNCPTSSFDTVLWGLHPGRNPLEGGRLSRGRWPKITLMTITAPSVFIMEFEVEA